MIVAKAENDCHKNVYEYCSLTQMNLCTVQYVANRQTAKAVPLSNAS